MSTAISKPVWQLPLSQFNTDITEQQINISIQNTAYTLYFQSNPIENNLFLSCYGNNQSPIYFGSYRCAFGNYINLIDNGFPYLLFFIDTTKNNYQNITFDTLNNGVNLYAKLR